MEFWIPFAIGLFAGVMIGVVVAGLLNAAANKTPVEILKRQSQELRDKKNVSLYRSQYMAKPNDF